jgi:hypothetical protein
MPQELAEIRRIVFDLETPGLVYLATRGGTGVYRSTDGGTSWERIDDLRQPEMQEARFGIAIATHPRHVLVVGARYGLPYRSLDGGATWEKAQGGGSDFMFADGDSTRLYAATGNGLFFSSDAGDTWERVAGVLGGLQIMALGYADTDGHTILYSATNGGFVGTTSSTAATTPRTSLATTSGLVGAGIYRYTILPTVSFSSSAYSVSEGDGAAQVTIKRSGLTTAANSVVFKTANGTAKAGSDYTAVSKTVSFAAGETSKTVSIPITDDSLVEGNETVQLSLSSPSSGAKLGTPSSATLTIQDNDRAFAFSAATYSVNEAGGPAMVTIKRTGLTKGSDSVLFKTANGTATAGSDYTAVSQTVSFAAGETQITVSVPIIDDSSVESSETVLLSLSNPFSGATLVSPHSATLTIIDNDVAPPPPAKPSGKIVSAKLSKKSFSSFQAGKVKLDCRFSPKSKIFRYVLSLKKGKKWAVVKSVNKTGFYKVKYTTTVKKLFAGKVVKRGQYRLKLSADKNSKALGFKVR